LSGLVTISGARFGNDRTLSLGLQNVLVGLVSLSSGQVTQWTLTDATGKYTFRNIDNLAGYELMLQKQALLDFSYLRISGRFLRVGRYEVYGGDLELGFPHNLTSPNFQLLIDDQSVPYYTRPQVAPQFEGDSKPRLFWQFQESGLAGNSRLRVLSTLQSQAASLIGCATSFTGSDDLESNLRAAALNKAWGRGFFEPYNLVQDWYLSYASHIFCAGISNSADQTLALRFTRAINMADDLDTYGDLTSTIEERQ
jgi:hypothetical protein